MGYAYLKAFHIIFVVTWFAGIFYMPRLFIYNTEAGDKSPEVRDVLRSQFNVMMKRLWYGITWPSAIITLILGSLVLHLGGWGPLLFSEGGRWLLIKICFVIVLYVYHFTLHAIFKQEMSGVFKYTSQQLRMWNEVATVLLVAIVVLVVVKSALSWVWAVVGMIGFIVVLLAAINIYKKLRK
ncbi:CopD family protein [Pinibacter aurantiacus]|uniref:Protoporphyrinogen IX oxidase n=1 Tax=Pinibacter aurantiacus TaxID=2851599 RepID=A0A9E2SAZ0_9BACT|nr:CopD family protein [Pinibacter aurantiacus]MBV4357869.1 CopD family protein [Pinibacter aurantiacus]